MAPPRYTSWRYSGHDGSPGNDFNPGGGFDLLVTTVGIDRAKNEGQVPGVARHGPVVLRKCQSVPRALYATVCFRLGDACATVSGTIDQRKVPFRCVICARRRTRCQHKPTGLPPKTPNEMMPPPCCVSRRVLQMACAGGRSSISAMPRRPAPPPNRCNAATSPCFSSLCSPRSAPTCARPGRRGCRVRSNTTSSPPSPPRGGAPGATARSSGCWCTSKRSRNGSI